MNGLDRLGDPQPQSKYYVDKYILYLSPNKRRLWSFHSYNFYFDFLTRQLFNILAYNSYENAVTCLSYIKISSKNTLYSKQ